MKKIVTGIWFSLPLQLLFLHFKRYQILLLFWYILFATVGGSFMKNYGANYLFLSPEYFDKVSGFSMAFVGFAMSIFIMSWNITTFILHSRYIKFLATTAQPFLKYCINNAIIPLAFLLYYLFKLIHFTSTQELLSALQIFWLLIGFAIGFLVCTLISALYFFSADKTIYYTMGNTIKVANSTYNSTLVKNGKTVFTGPQRIDWFFSAKLALRKPRDVSHYSKEFLESIFKRHHFAAAIAILIAFLCLVGTGFIADAKLFQFPAAASVTVFFAVLMAAVGACSIFFGRKSVIAILLTYLVLNYLFQQNIIDPTNKAYGLVYNNSNNRPEYSKESLSLLASVKNMEADKASYLKILNNWKARQTSQKPVLYVINVSGGGIRSATFTMNVLQELDKVSNGSLMGKTLFINGASGGLLGAAYFRELYNQKINGKPVDLQDNQYADNISKDLLNPLFSSFVCRDIMGSLQKFDFNNQRYVKDRAYAFEEKLNANTGGILNKQLKDYATVESKAAIPFMFFNSVVTQDGRKIIAAAQPVRFLMRPVSNQNLAMTNDADAIDFNSFFAQQQSASISILSALRMNATFPYALPNTALPSNPAIDVMDAGLRDNYGQETTLRFLQVFKDWFVENTSKVVVLQIRDRPLNNWDVDKENKQYMSFLTQPFLILQNNWYRLQDYYQQDALEYFAQMYGSNFERISFEYTPSSQNNAASLSFHLTAAEKRDIQTAVKNTVNTQSFKRFGLLNVGN